MVHGVLQVDGLAGARLAPPDVWQHLTAEMVQHAGLLGVHDGRRVGVCV